MDWEIAASFGAEGTVTHYIGFQRDITLRKREEQTLAESESRYRTLVDLSPDAIFVYADGMIVFANPATARLLGAKSTEEIVGLGLSDLVPLEQREPFQERLNQALFGQRTPNFEEQSLVRFDGGTVHVESAGIPITFAGKPAVQVLFHDLTERIKLEEQFHQAQRLESIGMLAAGIAHDLNNVLAPILLAAPMLRDSALAPADKGLLTDIEKSAVRGAGLVRQILGFAHGIAGEAQVVELKHLLHDIVSILSRTVSKSIRDPVAHTGRPLASQCKPHAGPPGYPQPLRQCARRHAGRWHAPPERGELHLDDAMAAALEAGARPGRWVVLQVQDTGTGIPPEVLARMWEPFYTTKPSDKGTGLGLSTVRGIVEGYSGFITVRTELGRGTTFRAYFPPAERALATTPTASLSPRGNGELVLVVDDDALIRVTTTAMLTRHGYRVLVAGDGAEALVLFKARQSEIALVITDLDMPHLAGEALAVSARKLKPDIPILTIGGVLPGKGAKAPSAFSDGFLMKPFTADVVLSMVHSLLTSTYPNI